MGITFPNHISNYPATKIMRTPSSTIHASVALEVWGFKFWSGRLHRPHNSLLQQPGPKKFEELWLKTLNLKPRRTLNLQARRALSQTTKHELPKSSADQGAKSSTAKLGAPVRLGRSDASSSAGRRRVWGLGLGFILLSYLEVHG